ncbi:hypothetical protein KIL84_018761 [Mauremys mutica]|uniref:Uncharacterized protein n=1 Tax=Mauremys mutica TaxID=74926 RepID=A0A9D4B2R0_9SAUR|nr:hypothetical protein KIL84_018761 [Mauremys mutica]
MNFGSSGYVWSSPLCIAVISFHPFHCRAADQPALSHSSLSMATGLPPPPNCTPGSESSQGPARASGTELDLPAAGPAWHCNVSDCWGREVSRFLGQDKVAPSWECCTCRLALALPGAP